MSSTIPVYIRFGDIPEDKQSKVHRSDEIIRAEGGVSVWECVQDDWLYYPILPENPNECAIADYFHMLFSDKPVYLVTGTRLCVNGACNEPLLMDDITIIKKLDYSYLRDRVSHKMLAPDLIDFLNDLYDKAHSDNETTAKKQRNAVNEVIKMVNKLLEAPND